MLSLPGMAGSTGEAVRKGRGSGMSVSPQDKQSEAAGDKD